MHDGNGTSLVYTDFVNREQQIAYLHDTARALDKRALVVEGRDGIGKTRLLGEFHAECRQTDRASVYVDLGEHVTEPDYWHTLFEFPNQLGVPHFQPLRRAFKEIGQKLDELRLPAPGHAAETGATAPAGRTDAADQAADEGNGGLEVGRDLIAPYANIAGRDIHIVYNLIRNGDPEDAGWVRRELSMALQECLLAYIQEKPLVILLDHWDRANDDTRPWIQQTLVKWHLHGTLRRSLLVIAHNNRPDWYEPRNDLDVVTVDELPEDAVHRYWTDICKLPGKELPSNLTLFAYPRLLVMAAQEVARNHGIVLEIMTTE